MGGDKGEYLVGDYYILVEWNNHGHHGKVGGLGVFQKMSDVWIR
jgi:hypothetical protein